MQGRNAHAIQLYDKIDALLKKMKRWRERVKEGIFSMFPSVDDLGDSAVLSPQVTDIIVAHLEALEGQLESTFLKLSPGERTRHGYSFH